MLSYYFRIVKRISCLFGLLVCGSTGFVGAQILDDSTKLVYGPTTTTYTYEKNIWENEPYSIAVDTSVINIHRFTTSELSQYQIQDLGVQGTATRPVYYAPPDIIGVRSGFKAYHYFLKDLDEFKFFDTKSPYSKIGAALGGNGRSRVDVGFNRSDSSNFNIGIDYRRIISTKQVSALNTRDQLIDSEGYDFYFMYFTPKQRYLVLADFSRNKTKAVDQGGIDTTGGFTYFDKQASVFLQNARTEVTLKKSHIYHQFKVHDALQIYQSFTRYNESNSFIEDQIAEDKSYFNKFYINEDTTLDVNSFVTNTLESGIKGNIGKNLFYSGYYKYRQYDFQYGWATKDTLGFDTLRPSTNGAEHYVGGQIRLALNKKYQLKGGLEVNLSGNQRLTGDLITSGFDVHLITEQYEPSFIEQAYLGNHDGWINNFSSIKTVFLSGGLTMKLGRTRLRPAVGFSTITDYVYFSRDTIPVQVGGTLTQLSPSVRFDISILRHFKLEGLAKYNVVTGSESEALPVPDLSANANLYYHNILFKGNMELQAGLDTHWNSSYFAPSYRVSTQQFFIQDQFEVPSFPIVDAYVNLKLGHAYIFFKMNNLKQVINKEGYFVAQNYVGERGNFDFGFYWMFFD